MEIMWEEKKMIEKLNRLFEPRYPRRYIGRHRAGSSVPQISLVLRRTRDAFA